MSEKYLGSGDLYMAFMDLKKAYDKIDRKAMWQVLQVYGVVGELLRAVESFYKDGEVCVRVGREEEEYFPVKIGLRHGCVMSVWLFNIFMDGVVRGVKARIREQGLDCFMESRENGK